MRVRILAALLAVFLLAGCAGISEEASEERQVIKLLDEQARIQTLPAEEQQREFVAAQAAYERAPDDMKRLRLAMLLTLPRTSWNDATRALQLLAEIKPAAPGQSAPRHDLARLLQALVGEQQRLLAEETRRIEIMQKQGAERQRLLQDAQRKVEEDRRKIEEERRKAEELQQKLDALRKIDREFRRRER